MSLTASPPGLHDFTVGADEGRSMLEDQVAETRRSRRGKKLRCIRENEIGPTIIAGLLSGDPFVQRKATVRLRELLSTGCNPPTEGVVRSVVPCIVQFLGRDHCPKLQYEAALILVKIACGASEYKSVIISQGAVPILLKLLVSESANVRKQAACALENIACNSCEHLKLVLRSGALSPSFYALYFEYPFSPLLKDTADALTRFFRGSLDQIETAFPVLGELILSNDDELMANAFWALLYLADTSDDVQAIIDEGFCPILVGHLLHSSSSVSLPVLSVVAKIAAVLGVQTQTDFGHEVLSKLKALLTRPRDALIEREACLVISNIAAGTKEDIRAVIEAGFMPLLAKLVKGGDGFLVKEHALRAIVRTTRGYPEDIRRTVEEGGIEALCLTLIHRGQWASCLIGLERILESMSCLGDVCAFAQEIRRCDGLERIRCLRSVDDADINKRAAKIFEKISGEKEEGEAPPLVWFP